MTTPKENSVERLAKVINDWYEIKTKPFNSQYVTISILDWIAEFVTDSGLIFKQDAVEHVKKCCLCLGSGYNESWGERCGPCQGRGIVLQGEK